MAVRLDAALRERPAIICEALSNAADAIGAILDP
jgi:hypothetical protein